MDNSIPIDWQSGTAFDFFISLQVLHAPDYFGLRSSWASGMRQRLPKREREVLANFSGEIGFVPDTNWLLSLPEPRNSKIALDQFEKLSMIDRVMAYVDFKGDLREMARNVIVTGTWGNEELVGVQRYYQDLMKVPRTKSKIIKYLDSLANSLKLIEGVYESLVTYYEMFFEEEEIRIVGILETGLQEVQEKEKSLSLIDLLKNLSFGIEIPEARLEEAKIITLIPSFWISPRISHNFGEHYKFIFSIRPENTSIIPGEIVPDLLLSGLNALSNSTRLKILRYISKEQLTATQISRKLRLRPPTVAHHLKSLRLAGLVNIFAVENQKEIFYTTRKEQVERLSVLLKNFISLSN